MSSPQAPEWIKKIVDASKMYKIHLSTGDEKEKSYVFHYLEYIIENYDKMEEYVMFLREKPLQFITITQENFENSLSNHYDRFLDRTYWTNILKCNDHGLPHHPGLKVGESFMKLFQAPKPLGVYEFCMGSQMCVHKSRIIGRPKEFYSTLLDLVKNKVVDDCVLERLWGYVFSP